MASAALRSFSRRRNICHSPTPANFKTLNRERQFLRRSSAKITDNAACSYSEISVPSWDSGETFATRYESVRQRTKVGLIDLVARKTQQLSNLNYECMQVFLVVKVMSQEYDLGDGHYKRNLSPKWFCKTSSSSPPLVLHDHVKDYNTKSTFSDSSLLARSFHRQVFIEDRKKMSFAQPLGASSGVLLCRHISSSSGKPEESSIKIDALGDVVPDGSVEAVQAMVNNLIGWSLEMKYLYPPVYCVQCVIMAIHDFTGFNWSTSVVLTALLASGLMWPVKMRIQRQVWELKILRMSIQNVRRVMQTCDPKDLAENKKLEAELTVKFEKCDLSYMPLCFLDLLIPMACIQAVKKRK
ncbi:unnamed protein product [Brassica oleracea var. botrytis]